MSAQTPATGSAGWPEPGDPGTGPHGRWTVADVKRRTFKFKDAWWTVLLVDPVAAPAVAFVANYTPITPNGLTYLSLLVGLASAAVFWLHTWTWLVVGALLYHASFTLDCMDGKVARLKGNGSAIGGVLDYIFDRIRVLAVTVGLFGGQFQATGQARYLYAGIATIFLDALRYMDALQIEKVRREMSTAILQSRRRVSRAVDALEQVARLSASRGGHLDDASVESALADARRSMAVADAASDRFSTDTEDGPAGSGSPVSRLPPESTPELAVVSEIQSGFEGRVPWYPAIRDSMLRHRIRAHLVSGVEFQMFVFIVGPLLNQVFPVTIAAAVCLLGFEGVILVKLGMSTGDFVTVNRATRAIATRLDEVIETVDPEGAMRREAATASSP